MALEAGGDAGGEDVPEVLGDDVGGDEIHQALGRALPAIVGHVAAVASADDSHGGLDLHAQHAAVMFDHEIVRGGVSPGFGYAELQFQGSSDETELRPFAARFRVADGFAWGFHLSLKPAPDQWVRGYVGRAGLGISGE